MSNGYEKIIFPIVALVIIGVILLFIGSQISVEEISQPFESIGGLAIGGAVFLIVLLIIIGIIVIYSRAR